jgi:hypothetical protein
MKLGVEEALCCAVKGMSTARTPTQTRNMAAIAVVIGVGRTLTFRLSASRTEAGPTISLCQRCAAREAS